ncbi:MAG: 50S ribosomal protein L25/general stress protein Ctc [Alphaproteobacteria bacterium]|nr:50S ribosomal protein L25/general stress protein Ctc [Alphaproteobacteria bacterium]
MKATYTFKAEARETSGKGASRALRRAGRLPAVLYGKGQEPIGFSIDANEFVLAYQKGGFTNKVVDVTLAGKTYHLLAREIQVHPVTDKPEHIDFLSVTKDSRVHVNVPVRLVNSEKSIGVKRGGTLNIVSHEVELICVPDSIPPVIKIDVTELDIAHSIHISAIKLPEGVTPANTTDFTLVTITGRAADEPADAAAAAAAPAAAAKPAAKK